MKRVTDLGSVFHKVDDPEALYRWYEEHLGIRRGRFVRRYVPLAESG